MKYCPCDQKWQFKCTKYCTCHENWVWNLGATSPNIAPAAKSLLVFDSAILCLYYSFTLLFFDFTILWLYILLFYSTILWLFLDPTILWFCDLVRISEVSQRNFLRLPPPRAIPNIDFEDTDMFRSFSSPWFWITEFHPGTSRTWKWIRTIAPSPKLLGSAGTQDSFNSKVVKKYPALLVFLEGEAVLVFKARW